MRKAGYIILFVSISLSIHAQNDSVRTNKNAIVDTVVKKNGANFYKNSLSINFISFFENIFKSNVSPNLNTSFLYYTRNFKNSFVRVGLNGWGTQNNQTNDQTKEKTTANNFYSSASLAFYFTKNLKHRFTVAYGVNLIGGYIDSTRNFITPVDKVTYYNQSYFYGIAPGILINYNITKHLGIFVEYTLPLKVINSKSGTKYNLFPSENSTDRSNQGFSIQVFNPPSLYLTYKF